MKPKIRIKGFSGDWTEDLLGNHADIYQPKTIPEAIFTTEGYDVYGANGIIGKYHKYNHETEQAMIACRGSSCGVVNFSKPRSWINGNAMIINVDKYDIEKHFVKYLLEHEDFSSIVSGSGQPQIVRGPLLSWLINYPADIEQKALAEFFQKIDKSIELTQCKLSSIKQIRSASLQALIPKEGATKPSIRFSSFENDWKICKLDEILVERHEASTITPDLPQLSFTIADGVIRPEDRKSNQRDFLIKDKDNKRYLITRVGDIIYNPANVVYGAIHRNSLTDGVVSPIYRIFTTNQDSRFIECLVRRPSFISQMAMRTEGTVTKLKTLKPEAFLEMSVCIPTDSEEQRLIGEYFRNLDLQITLQTQRLEKLKQIKVACLDNMFV
ncbi:MAG: restriction endonuclease subunit S [Paludibacteraceae bacterium]|nr:restriction endonuclease subunit S [Paludibacteraceae bacterium]